MGREVRMVPPHWQHPSNERGEPVRMHDLHIDDALADWLNDLDRLRRGEWTDEERELHGAHARD